MDNGHDDGNRQHERVAAGNASKAAGVAVRDSSLKRSSTGPSRPDPGLTTTCGSNDLTRRRFDVDQPSGVDSSIAEICSITDNLSWAFHVSTTRPSSTRLISIALFPIGWPLYSAVQ